MESATRPLLTLAAGVLLIVVALLGQSGAGAACAGTRCGEVRLIQPAPGGHDAPCVVDHACGGGGAIAHAVALPAALGLLVLLLPGRRTAPARTRRLWQRLLASGLDHPPRQLV